MPDTNLTDINPAGAVDSASAPTASPASDSETSVSGNPVSPPTTFPASDSETSVSGNPVSPPTTFPASDSGSPVSPPTTFPASDSGSPVSLPTAPDSDRIGSPSDAAAAESAEGNDSSGTLKISVVSSIGMVPVENATVTVSFTGDPQAPLYVLTTDNSGQTPVVDLPAPPRELSLQPENEQQPYSEYNIEITADNYEPVLISGSEVLASELSLQPVQMNPLAASKEDEKIVIIPAHTLFGTFPPKIPEEEIKPTAETGEIVLSRVVIPEYVIVHDGVPGDSTAPNYWVRYKDYIKNVASCEIYSTWPENALYANILVIMSFTLNRVYTEWYRKSQRISVCSILLCSIADKRRIR